MKSDKSKINNRYVLALAIPMILSNITTPLVGIVDTAVVGHLGSANYIGAVTIGAVLFSFLYWGFGFLRMATTGYIARAKGAGDNNMLALTGLRATLLAVFISLLILVLHEYLIRLALWLFKADKAIEDLTAIYAGIRVYSAPATLLGYVITGIFIGLQRTHHALYFQLFINLTNIILDLLFVYIFSMHVDGVALATVIAEYLGLLYAAYLLRDYFCLALSQYRHPSLFNRAALLELTVTNTNILIRTLCLVFSISFFTAQSAKLGAVALAANGIIMHLQSLCAFALDGLAFAAESICGHEYGAKNHRRFERAKKITLLWSFNFAFFIAVIYLFFGGYIGYFFTDQKAVIDYLLDYLIWAALLPLFSFYCFLLDGIFIGCGHTQDMRNAMVFSTFIYIPVSYILLWTYGNHGLLFALSLFMLLRGISLHFYLPRILKVIQP